MDRRIAETVLLAGLAVVALAAAAATLPSATEPGGGAGSGPPGPGSGQGRRVPDAGPAVEIPTAFSLPEWLLIALLVVGLVVLLLVVLANWRQALVVAAAVVGLVVLLAFLFWLASTFEPGSSRLPVPNGSLFDQPAGSAGEGTSTAPQIVVLLVVGLALLGALALFLRTSVVTSGSVSEDVADPSEDAAAVGRAAGRAADRIETTDDLDNEIYRAWREMTGLLDVARPDATTPGEFAEAAVTAGMDPDDVDALTRLFEDVRYGAEEPTRATEGRALAILRRIEAAYVPEEGAT